MRVGQNPEKSKEILLEHKQHRVIIPIFIPNEEGFHANALEVFRLNLESLISTIGDETNITVINNDSIPKVNAFLQPYLESGKIDRYVVNRENRGKAEVVLAAARSSWEEFITVADADILFYDGWVGKVAEAFHAFPKAGVVALLTFPDSVNRATTSVLFDNFFRGAIKAGKIVKEEELKRSYQSIGLSGSERESKALESKRLYLVNDGEKYLIGANHAVATYRREVFFYDIETKVKYPFRRKAKLIKNFMDIPSDKCGFWRISFPQSYAYHMGNSILDWYDEKIRVSQSNMPREKALFPKTKPKRSITRILPYGWISKYVMYGFKFYEKRYSKK